MVTRKAVLLAALGAFACGQTILGATRVEAQDPRLEYCRPATADADSVIHLVQRIAAGETMLGRNTVTSAISRAVTSPFYYSEGPCPYFRPDVDPGQALLRIMTWAAGSEDESVAGQVMKSASFLAYRRSEELGWTPTEFLFRAAVEARTEMARAHALTRLIAQATDPQIRNRLLAMIRQPTGPVTWPSFPTDIVTRLQFMFQPGARALDEALQEAPGLIRNARARWFLECGRDHMVPRDRSDPCHPANAPPPVGGGD